MSRLVSLAGALLVAAGLALLTYVGVSYFRQSSSAPGHWSAVEQKQGRQIAARLTGHQRVAAPLHSTAQPGTEPALRMVIPKISVDARVVQTPPIGGVWNVADWAIGHLSSTPAPGSPGNGGYAAHDDIKGELFKRLGELKPGDEVDVYTAHARYVYSVVSQQTVDPSNVGVLAPTKVQTITLITCTPYWVDTYRLVVQAVLESRSLR